MGLIHISNYSNSSNIYPVYSDGLVYLTARLAHFLPTQVSTLVVL